MQITISPTLSYKNYSITKMQLSKFSSLLIGLTLLLKVNPLIAQYEPQAPLAGHGAIHRADVQIKDWVKDATFEPGFIQITDTMQGKVPVNLTNNALGVFDYLCLSLGDGGKVTCTFEYPITNGPGADFVVFENGFKDLNNDSLAFLELAFVEVSSNGIDFVRFPAICNTQDTIQIENNNYINASHIHNLAGKYIANWGTPFDLDELKDANNLDINHITHVRIVDAIGILDEALGSRDHNGRLINDPFPTPFITGGFDLDAIGVINNKSQGTSLSNANLLYQISPNPTQSKFIIQSTQHVLIDNISLYNSYGQKVLSNLSINEWINIESLPKGVYFINIQNSKDEFTYKLVKE